MNILGRLSLKMKILMGVLFSSALAVTTASIVFVTLEEENLTRDMERDSATIAKVVAGNAAGALAFEDASSAAEALGTLQAHENIIGAVIYTLDGDVFASYSRENPAEKASAPSSFPRQPASAGLSRAK